MIRSAIIKKAQSLRVQADRDDMWSNENWDMFFNEAVDMMQDALLNADSNYFEKTATLTKKSDETYDLPSDLDAVLSVKDSTGMIYRVTKTQETTGFANGYKLVNDTLELVNWDSQGSKPATLTMNYKHEPKTIPDWDGSDDPTTPAATALLYTPDSPLNSAKAGRALARMIDILASIKDESATAEKAGLAQQMADMFVDKFLARNEAE